MVLNSFVKICSFSGKQTAVCDFFESMINVSMGCRSIWLILAHIRRVVSSLGHSILSIIFTISVEPETSEDG